MRVELKNCTVSVDIEYIPRNEQVAFDREEKAYYLKVSIPLPGGTANYRFSIQKEQYNNLELAQKLSEAK